MTFKTRNQGDFDLIVTRLFFSILLILLTYQSIHNFISHSELWAIASGRIFGNGTSESTILYVKPLFYFILNLPYKFDLGNSEHIKVSRFLFGLIGFSILFIWYLISLVITRSRRTSIFYSIFLLSFHLIAYNIFRVRADIMACFFGSLVVFQALKMRQAPTLGNLDWIKLLTLFCAIFLCTPKGITIILPLLTFSYFCTKRTPSKSPHLIWSALLAASPLLTVGLVIASIFPTVGYVYDPYSVALIYFGSTLELFTKLSSWEAFLTSLKINFLQYLLILWSLIELTKKRSQSKRAFPLVALSGSSLTLMLLFPEKWEYYLASVIPFVASPSIFLIDKIIKTKKGMFTFLAASIIPLIMTSFANWHVPNKTQFEYIEDFDELNLSFEDPEYFDSLGLLPRAPSILMYVGPNDHEGNVESFEKVKRRRPTFIVYSEKISHARELFQEYLLHEYESVFPGVFIDKEKASQINEMDFKELTALKKHNPMKLFIYDYRPKVLLFD